MSAASAESQTPKRERPRFWLIVGGSLLLMALGALCAILFQKARHERHLRAAVAELDRDEPGWKLDAIEASRAVIPESENSARVVVAVHKLLPGNWPSEELSKALENLEPEQQLSPEAAALLRAELARVEPALAQARALAERPRGRHHIKHAKNPLATLLTDQQNTRAVAHVLAHDALRHAQEGDLKAALVSCRAAVNAGRSLGDEPYLISQLIRTACVEVAGREIERVLARGEPPVEELEALQKLLTDEEEHPMLLLALRGERAGQHAIFEALKSGQVSLGQLVSMGGSSGGVDWMRSLVGEDINVEHARVLALMTRRVRDAERPLHEQAPAEQAFDAEISSLPDRAIITRLILPATTKFGEIDRRRRAHLRCLISAIACERYRQVEGKWPTSLADLGPKYLASVPADPHDGKPLRLARLADGLVVYSVGPDGSDDGGKLNRRNPLQPGTDLGFRLWDVTHRRQPPAPPAGPVQRDPQPE